MVLILVEILVFVNSSRLPNQQVSSFKVYWLSALYMPLTIYNMYLQVMTNRFPNSALYKKLSILRCNSIQIIINKFGNIATYAAYSSLAEHLGDNGIDIRILHIL